MSSDYTCPEEVWDLLEPLIPQHLPKPHPLGCYRQPIPDRQVADAIWYVMRTGCQWGALDPTGLAKHSTAHARFQEWVRAGVFFRLWQKSLEGFDCLVGLDGHWLCVDGARGKAPLGGKETGKNPTDRGKLGVKRSVAIEGHGVPVGLVIAGANRHDCKLLEETLAPLPVARPAPTLTHRPQVCLDKGYDFRFVRALLARLAYGAHIRRIGQEAPAEKNPQKPPRRWKVERTISWFNRFRGILIRWAKQPENYLAFCHFASAVIALRMAYSLADCQFG